MRQVNAALSDDLYRELETIAKSNGISVRSTTNILLVKVLKAIISGDIDFLSLLIDTNTEISRPKLKRLAKS